WPLVDHLVVHRAVTGRRLGLRRRGGWRGRRRRGRCGRWCRRRWCRGRRCRGWRGRRGAGAVTVDETAAGGTTIDAPVDIRVPGEGGTHVAPLVFVIVDAYPAAAGVVRAEQPGHTVDGRHREHRRVRPARRGRTEADVVRPAHVRQCGERGAAVGGPEQAGLTGHPHVTGLAGYGLDADEPLRWQAGGSRREVAPTVGADVDGAAG